MKKALFLLAFIANTFMLSAQVTQGTFYKIQNNATSFYVGIDGKTNQGDPILQQSTVGDGGLWEFVAQSGGYFVIKNKVSGRYIDNFSSTAPAAALKQNTNVNDGAMWSLVDAGGGYFKLKNKKSNMFMGINGATASHTPVVQLLTVAEGGKWKFLGDGSAGGDPVAQNKFSMIFMADPQYPWVKDMSQDDSKIKEQSKNFMTEQVESMNHLISQSNGNIKGVIANGDLTAFGRKSEMDVTMNHYSNLTVPLYLGLGNHDYENCVDDTENNASASYMVKYIIDHISAKTKTGFDYVKTGNKHSGSLAYSWDFNNIHFVQLHNHPAYEYSWTGTPPGGTQQQYEIKASFNWLENDMNQARKAGKGIILNMHDLGDFNATSYPAAYNRLKAMADKYEVAAVFVGHYHGSFGQGGSLGNAPIYYCGAPFYKNYLSVDFKHDKMDVKKITFDFVSPGGNANIPNVFYGNVPISVAAKSLPMDVHPVSACTAYSQNNDGQVLEFTNSAAFQLRTNVRYLDTNGEMQNWYGDGDAKAWLPQNASDIAVYMYAKIATAQKIIYSLDLNSERNVCFKIKGNYDSPWVEICGTVPSSLGFLKFKNTGGYQAIYEVEYFKAGDTTTTTMYTDDVLAGQERIFYLSGPPKTIKLKVKSTDKEIFLNSNDVQLNACYKSSGLLPNGVKFEPADCVNAPQENYVRFKNTGAYIAVFSVTTPNGVFDSGDVLAGQEKTVYFAQAATNLTARVKSGKQIASITNPGFNTCYKSWGILTSPKFGEGCD